MESVQVCCFCLCGVENDKFIDLREEDGDEEKKKTRDKLKVLFTEEVSILALRRSH